MVVAYIVRLFKVLGEDPWRVERLEEHWFSDWEEARERFLEELERLEEEGYSCMDHASAWHQLCVRQAGSETMEEDGLEVVIPVLEKRLLVLEPHGPTG